MKKTIFAAMILLAVSSMAQAQFNTLPNFTLPDPHGGMHSSSQLAKNGLVLVVTAPTLRDKNAQKGWNKYLVAAKGANKASFVFIEDLSVSMFKGIAMKDMKKDWQPGDIPILLIDQTGKTRKTFGVERNTTKVFVYNKSSKLVYTYAGSPTATIAKTIWSKISN